MTETEAPTPVDPWPVPDRTLLPEEWLDAALVVARASIALEPLLQAYLDAAPVKAHPDHPVYVHDLASMVDSFETIIDRLKLLRDEMAEHLARAVPFQTSLIAFSDCRPMTPHWGGNRTRWENDILQSDVKPRILHDPESGEARTPEEVMEVAFSVVSLIGSNVKVTGLRALGIEADDYCHKEPKAPTIQVTKEFGS